MIIITGSSRNICVSIVLVHLVLVLIAIVDSIHDYSIARPELQHEHISSSIINKKTAGGYNVVVFAQEQQSEIKYKHLDRYHNERIRNRLLSISKQHDDYHNHRRLIIPDVDSNIIEHQYIITFKENVILNVENKINELIQIQQEQNNNITIYESSDIFENITTTSITTNDTIITDLSFTSFQNNSNNDTSTESIFELPTPTADGFKGIVISDVSDDLLQSLLLDDDIQMIEPVRI